MATARYPLIEEPLPPGLVTLEDYARRIGRSIGYLRSFWLPRPRFPEPVNELAGRSRHSGGRRRKVYTEAALDAFRASQPDLQEHRPAAIVTDRDWDERVTLYFFAVKVAGKDLKTIYQYRDASGFPEAGEDGMYRLGDLLDFFNNRPGKRGPAKRPRKGSRAEARPTGSGGRPGGKVA